MRAAIRERTQVVLDALPCGETFDWVEKVSIKLTTMMLATLFDFPFEERGKLTYWSDVAICQRRTRPTRRCIPSDERFEELKKMGGGTCPGLFEERAAAATVRSAVDAGAWGGDPGDAAARVHGQPGATDRRGQ